MLVTAYSALLTSESELLSRRRPRAKKAKQAAIAYLLSSSKGGTMMEVADRAVRRAEPNAQQLLSEEVEGDRNGVGNQGRHDHDRTGGCSKELPETSGGNVAHPLQPGFLPTDMASASKHDLR